MSDFLTVLESVVSAEKGSVVGLEFCRFLKRLDPKVEEDCLVAAYLLCCAVEGSHSCLFLKGDFSKTVLLEHGLEGFSLPEPEKLSSSKFIGDAQNNSPLILDEDRLYLSRYFQYECEIAEFIKKRAKSFNPPPEQAYQFLHELHKDDPARPNWQKLAALSACSRHFLVISGGPGTGKTRTVAVIMLVLNKCLGIDFSQMALAAPTGKAAARLSNSVSETIKKLCPDASFNPNEHAKAKTIHRLLGMASDWKAKFRFNRDNPLPYKVVIVDETSMIDLPLMAHFMRALSPDTRLILLGDKDQLASVEAGSIMADICNAAGTGPYSKDFVEMANQAKENVGEPSKDPHFLRDCVITLTHNYRFGHDSGIHKLANAVNKGNIKEALELFERTDLKDISFLDAEKEENSLETVIVNFTKGFIDKIKDVNEPQNALKILEKFKILCAIKDGIAGTGNINRFISWHFFNSQPGTLHQGLPVIINENNYRLGLFNGDTGVIWQDRFSQKGSFMAWFETEGEMMCFSPARMPKFDPAWAITVHKSQGSEFQKVLLILPNPQCSVLGRELLYTAITRAREKIIIWGTKSALETAMKKSVRMTGLSEKFDKA